MDLKLTIEQLENIKKTIEALRNDRVEAAKYVSFLDGELNKLQVQEKELQQQSIGAYKGRSSWTQIGWFDEARQDVCGVLGAAGSGGA